MRHGKTGAAVLAVLLVAGSGVPASAQDVRGQANCSQYCGREYGQEPARQAACEQACMFCRSAVFDANAQVYSQCRRKCQDLSLERRRACMNDCLGARGFVPETEAYDECTDAGRSAARAVDLP